MEFIIVLSCWLIVGFLIGYGSYFYLQFKRDKEKDKISLVFEEENKEEILEKPKEKYDVVYVLSNDIEGHSEELRYSLRSLENFTYNKVWFAGGQPRDLTPDRALSIIQRGDSRYLKVCNTLIEVCKNEDVTDNFYLFNDDFFILEPYNQYINYYVSSLDEHIVDHEDYYSGITGYSDLLRTVNRHLKKDGYKNLSYEIHMPMLVNKQQALEVLSKYKSDGLFRSLYGNICKIQAKQSKDCKIFAIDQETIPEGWNMVSTTEDTFKKGAVGQYIREYFPNKSRFEK